MLFDYNPEFVLQILCKKKFFCTKKSISVLLDVREMGRERKNGGGARNTALIVQKTPRRRLLRRLALLYPRPIALKIFHDRSAHLGATLDCK